MGVQTKDPEQRKAIHVSVRLEPYTYSRLLLLAHRHNRTLAAEMRAALKHHIREHGPVDEEERAKE